jgi:hypothetical protein
VLAWYSHPETVNFQKFTGDEAVIAAAMADMLLLIAEADPAVLEEAGEAVSALEHVVHRLGDARVTGEMPALAAHPGLEIGDQ